MRSFAALEFSLLSALLSLHYASGELELLLSGYTNIATDDSAVLAIPYIGTHDQGTALVCRHGLTGIPPSAAIDKWFFVRENGDEEEISSSGDSHGFSVSRGQMHGEVRLERVTGASPLEGTYKCSVETGPSVIETVTVELYWPLSSLEVSIEVLCQTTERLQFAVSCRSEGGSLVGSSLTGPHGELLGQLTRVDNEAEMRGADVYSLVVERTEGQDGDVFNCTAATRGSSHTARVALSVAADVEDVVVTQVPSSSPTLNISWSLGPGGAPIINYTLHYTSAGMDGRGDHNGSVTTAGGNSAVVIEDLLGDGRTYSVVVEAHSLHLSSFSETLSYTPCVVSQLLLSSKTHDSLLLTWERPEYFTASLRGLLYYEPLPQQQAGSEGMWLFVESGPDYLPPLEGLQELTNYSISMAVLDTTDRLCVFNEPLVAQTGLGRVRDLKISAERNEIALTWSPPHAPSGLSLNYTVTYISSADNSRTTTTTTNNQSWRIRAKLGDVYTVTVTPNVKFCSGESLAVTVGLDYKSFQIRIDNVERCGDILEKDSEAKLSSVVLHVQQILSNSCNCDALIGEAEFDCLAHDEHFVIFRGVLFAPVTTTSASLFSQLEDWVASGPQITIAAGTNTVSSKCMPDEMYAESTECVATSVTSTENRPLATREQGGDYGVGVLAGAAVGSFVVGVLSCWVLLFTFHIVRRRQRRKQVVVLRQQAHGLMTSRSNGHNKNPRYVSADKQTANPLPPRELPLLPLIAPDDTITFTNPLTNRGAPEMIRTEAYETVPEPGKVPNPMYEVLSVNGKRERRSQQEVNPSQYEDMQLVNLSQYEDMQQVNLSQYEDVELVKKEVEARKKWEDEYITMQPTCPSKPNGCDPP